MRYLWLSIGALSLVLGLVGSVLPLLPTTPFILLAAFCFANSSPRFHLWLVEHPAFGPPIRDWRLHGAISRGAKLAGTLAMAAAFLLSALFRLDAVILIIQALVMAGVLAFLWTRPTAGKFDGC